MIDKSEYKDNGNFPYKDIRNNGSMGVANRDSSKAEKTKVDLEVPLEDLIVEKGLQSLEGQIECAAQKVKQAVQCLGADLGQHFESTNGSSEGSLGDLIIGNGIQHLTKLETQVDRAREKLGQIILYLGIDSIASSESADFDSELALAKAEIHAEKQVVEEEPQSQSSFTEEVDQESERPLEALVMDCEESLTDKKETIGSFIRKNMNKTD